MHESHPLFAELMTERLWAITPDALSSLDAMLASSNGKDTAPAPRAAATASHGGGPLLYAVREGVAIIDISGTIHRYGDPEWDAVGHDTIKAAVSLAMQDRSASALLLRFNSPGGVASGVPALAAWLATQTAKPVYAYADGLCASAAYYLAAATGRVYAPATATVGSIGVICRHMDWSGFLEKCGVRVTHLTGGAWKAAGNDAEPLTDEVKAYLQQPINELHTMFRADVAAHMPVDASAPETWGDGQVFLASRAHELGLVTGIVPGMDALIALINTTKEKPMDRIELASSHPELLAQIEADAKKQGAAEANAAMETQQQQAVQAALDNRMALFAAVAGAEAAQRVETLAAAGITSGQLQALGALIPSPAPASGQTAGTPAQQAILAHLTAQTPGPLDTSAGLKSDGMASTIDRIASL